MESSSKPMTAALVLLCLFLVALVGYMAFRTFSPPRLEYPQGVRGAAGPGAAMMQGGARPPGGR